MNFVHALHWALEPVAPLHGVSIGRLDDPATWRIDAHDDADAGALAARLADCAKPGGFALVDNNGLVHLVVQDRRAPLGERSADLGPLTLIMLPEGAPALAPLRWRADGPSLIEVP